MGLWASDSRDGIPAGIIHLEATDRFGRPMGPACGISTDGLWLFRTAHLDDVPPWWRCSSCAAETREVGRDQF